MGTKKSRGSRAARADFPYAIKSFLGFLEGTEKALHTIKNYRLDLLSFVTFLQESGGSRPIRLEEVSARDVERFHDWLRDQGQRTNTRRRKLLTVQNFLNYLSRRKKVAEGVARKVPTPHKIERIPATVSWKELAAAIRKLPSETLLDARNRALLWTLAETGCQVSEAARLCFSDFAGGGKPSVQINGKSERTVPVSADLIQALETLRALQKSAGAESYAFVGFNRFGPMPALGGKGSPITPRGVELLVKSLGPRLGFDELTPRTFRHSVVLHWFAEGISREEIQRRLGLTTPYAFRTYDLMLKDRGSDVSP